MIEKKIAGTAPRLEPKIWNKIEYVIFTDIVKFHGVDWFRKWNKDFGMGQTCPVIEDGKTEPFGACYYSDYLKSANKIDYGIDYLLD